MKIKVSTLKDEKLAEWMARAQGWKIEPFDQLAYWVSKPSNNYICSVYEYRPDINGGQAMELVKKFGVSICSRYRRDGGQYWHVQVGPEEPENSSLQVGQDNLNVAICRAVAVSVYGEYVEDSD